MNSAVQAIIRSPKVWALVAVVGTILVGAFVLLTDDGDETPQDKTDVINFSAPDTANETVDGSCFSPSLAVTRDDAWRCSVDNEILDPCFGSMEDTSVICVEDPLSANDAVMIRLASPLSDVEPFPAEPEPHPWALETQEGVLCTYLTGATGPVNGKRINYGCADGASIIGDPQPGATWMARLVRIGGSIPPPGTPVPEQDVRLRRVWQ